MSTVSVERKDKVTAVTTRNKDVPKHRSGPFHSGGTGEKAMNFGPSLRRLLGHLKPERARLIAVTLMAAIGVGLGVTGPKILGRATDLVFAGAIGAKLPHGMTKKAIVASLRAKGETTYANMLDKLDVVPGRGIQFDQLRDVALLVLGIYVVSGVLMWLQGWLLAGIVQRSIYRMRTEVADKIDRLPLSYFDAQPRGELLSRVTNDIDNMSQSLQQTLSQLLTSLLTVIGVLIMMFWTSPVLTWVALATLPVIVAVAMIIGKRSQKLFVASWANTGKLNAHIEEAFTGHALVKVFGRQREVAEEFRSRNSAVFSSSFGAQFVSGMMMPIIFFIGNINYVLVAVIGGLRVAHGQMSLGDVQAFIQYSRQFTQPVTQIASMSNLMQSGVASAERVFQVLDADEMVPEVSGSLEELRGAVEFQNVDFSYTDEPLITGLNLSVEPGQTVAIVGPTGAGKTTLVNLLMRFYEVDGGTIGLDGVDITSVPRHELRRGIGMVLQDTWLFHGTIRENLAYGRPGASEEEIRAAAKACYVDRFVHSLPDGYDTMIDEEASNVSAGEKQLLTIARAFLANPALLILDEATSSVDTRTEVLVQHAMKRLRANRTSFVIAHRLSTIRDADVIVVMENGHIVQQGSHDELLHTPGPFRTLWDAQFSAAAE